MKNLHLLSLISVLTFSQLSYAQMSNNNDKAEDAQIPEPNDICYHGTVDNLFEEIIATVPMGQQCPSGAEVPHIIDASSLVDSGSNRQHDQNDPRCRITKVCAPNFPCGSGTIL